MDLNKVYIDSETGEVVKSTKGCIDFILLLIDKEIPEVINKEFDIERLMAIKDEDIERYYENSKIYKKYTSNPDSIPPYIDYTELGKVVNKCDLFLANYKIKVKGIDDLIAIREKVYDEYRYWNSVKESISEEEITESGLFGIEVKDTRYTKIIDKDATVLTRLLRKILKGIDFIIKDYNVKLAEKEKEAEKNKKGNTKEISEVKKLLLQFVERSDFKILTDKQINKKLTANYTKLAKDASPKIAFVFTFMEIVKRVDELIDYTLEDTGVHRKNNVSLIDEIKDELSKQYDRAIESRIVNTGIINTLLNRLVLETGLSDEQVTVLIFNAENDIEEKKPRERKKKKEREITDSRPSVMSLLGQIEKSV